LNNDVVFDGKITKIKDCTVVIKVKGEKYYVPVSDIYSVEFENIEDRVYRRYMKLADGDPQKCLHGATDAAQFHGKKGGHFFLGVLFGPFAMLGTLMANPNPDNSRKAYQLSKHKDEFNDPEYLSCYKKKAKGQLIGMEALGWGAWILFVLAASSGG
jgi:hypothetical protein